MAGLPYSCRCSTITGAIPPIEVTIPFSIGDIYNPNPPANVPPPATSICLCNTAPTSSATLPSYTIPANTPFLLLGSGGGGGGGSNSFSVILYEPVDPNYVYPNPPYFMAQNFGAGGGSGAPLVSYFHAKPYPITITAKCGNGGYGAGAHRCNTNGAVFSNYNGGNGGPTIITIGTQTVYLVGGQGGESAAGLDPSNKGCNINLPIARGGGGFKCGEGGRIMSACVPNFYLVYFACSMPAPSNLNDFYTFPKGGASLFSKGGVITACDATTPVLGAGGAGGGDLSAYKMCLDYPNSFNYPYGNYQLAQNGADGAVFIILNPTPIQLAAYGVAP